MAENFTFLLGLTHVPLGAYLAFFCLKAQRSLTDTKALRALDIVIAFSGAVIATRLTQMAIPLDDIIKISFWRTLTTAGLLAFIPLINSLVRIERRKRQ